MNSERTLKIEGKLTPKDVSKIRLAKIRATRSVKEKRSGLIFLVCLIGFFGLLLLPSLKMAFNKINDANRSGESIPYFNNTRHLIFPVTVSAVAVFLIWGTVRFKNSLDPTYTEFKYVINNQCIKVNHEDSKLEYEWKRFNYHVITDTHAVLFLEPTGEDYVAFAKRWMDENNWLILKDLINSNVDALG